MAGISSIGLKFGYNENKRKYNGIEYNSDLELDEYEAFYRNLDPQTARWWQLDPKTDGFEWMSPYASMYDDPAKISDPLGDEGEEANNCCKGSKAILKGSVELAGTTVLLGGGPADVLADGAGLAELGVGVVAAGTVALWEYLTTPSQTPTSSSGTYPTSGDPFTGAWMTPALNSPSASQNTNLAQGNTLTSNEKTELSRPLYKPIDKVKTENTKKGVIYEVPGKATSSGKPYIGRTKHPTPGQRRSDGGRDRKKAKVVDEYDPNNTQEGREKEQKKIDEKGLDNLDNRRNEIKPKKKND